MKNTIKEKSGVEISFFFKVLKNDVFHTSNAFDSDYTWDYKLEVSETDFKSISEQIEKSKFYNPEGSYNFGEAIYDSLKVYNLKGYWVTGKNMYIFYPAKEQWAESTNIQVDKSKRTIKVNLVHL